MLKPYKENREKFWLIAFILVFWAAGMALAMTTTAIGDTGDSLVHYFFARYAYRHPSNFFDLWAKPVYVLLASPFAQFGFTGIKVFNVTVAAISLWLVYDAARLLGLRYAYFAVWVLASCTFYIKLMFSGLTEHLFACWLLACLVLFLRKKNVPALLLLSFLPFVRSEGWIITGALLPYFIYARMGRYIPLLATGYLLVGTAGALYFGDALWIVRQDTYPLHSSYGRGPLGHFAVMLYYVMGLVNYILLGLGTGTLVLYFFRNAKQYLPFLLLVAFPFLAFVGAHSLFWYLGIFHSMGLERVLNAVLPLAALVGAFGADALLRLLKNNTARIVLVTTLSVVILLFPFSGHISAVHWKRDLDCGDEVRAAGNIARYVRAHYPGYRYCYASPLFTYAMDIDCFDHNRALNFNDYRNGTLPDSTLILWDGAFAVVEYGMQRQLLDSDTALDFVTEVKAEDTGVSFVLYEKRIR